MSKILGEQLAMIKSSKTSLKSVLLLKPCSMRCSPGEKSSASSSLHISKKAFKKGVKFRSILIHSGPRLLYGPAYIGLVTALTT